MPSLCGTKKLKIFFHPIDAAGHINACIGLAQALAERGHKIYFLSDTSFDGHFSKFGFNEILLKDHKKLAEPEEETKNGKANNKENPFKSMSEKMDEMGMFENQTSFEGLKLSINNTIFDEMCQKVIAFNDQIKDAIDREQPDAIVVDNFIFEPVILHSNIPWILVCSCNPIMLYESKELPPMFSGYPVNSDKETWREFEEFLETHFTKLIKDKQNEILKHFNYLEIEDKNQQMIYRSKYMNVYGYPEELDYNDVVARPDNQVRVDAFCRKMPEQFEFPIEFRNKIKPDDKLIYVSLGSMGSFNVKLMKRMIEILGKTKHKYIVSKGPLHTEFELADNMWGAEYIPQTSILPLVDLVITHGGNNTVTESFNFGKPMIVMPMFADQYDNAQRLQEKGFGIRLHTHQYTDQELVDSIDQLLNDFELNQKLCSISERIQHSNSKEKACIAIELMVDNHKQQQTNGI